MLEFLEKEQIDKGIIQGIREYREKYPAAPELAGRVPRPRYHYYGKDVWEAAAAALLCGENLLLAGSKATGKNVLAENLAMAFGRPAWDVSVHVNMDAASLIGMDTFVGGQVTFRPGPVYLCAKNGGFGILDEINMAKNEALAAYSSNTRVASATWASSSVLLAVSSACCCSRSALSWASCSRRHPGGPDGARPGSRLPHQGYYHGPGRDPGRLCHRPGPGGGPGPS